MTCSSPRTRSSGRCSAPPSSGSRWAPPNSTTARDVPVYTSSPGDSSIGMNAAALSLSGESIHWDVFRDVNETAAIVPGAKKSGGKSAILILGGGSPKNFALQTEPQIQEVLGIP